MSVLGHQVSLGSTGGSRMSKMMLVAIIIVAVVVAAVLIGARVMENQRMVASKESYDHGMRAYKKGNIADATKRLEEAVSLNPKDYNARTNLARGYASTNRLEDAEKEYLASIKINQNQPEVHYNLGNIYTGKREFEKALASFKKAKELNKSLYPADIMIAQTYREMGEPDKSVDILTNLIASKPFGADLAYLQVQLGLAYRAKGKGEAARKAWEEALKIDPKNFEAKRLMDAK